MGRRFFLRKNSTFPSAG